MSIHSQFAGSASCGFPKWTVISRRNAVLCNARETRFGLHRASGMTDARHGEGTQSASRLVFGRGSAVLVLTFSNANREFTLRNLIRDVSVS